MVDIPQCPLQGDLVLDNAQFRLTGEVADTVHKELNVLLERRTRREWRLVTALQAIQHQAAARRQYIAEQRHLWAAQTVEHHVDAAVVGELVDLHQQVLLFRDDDFLGTKGQQVFTLITVFGRGNHPHTQGFAQLHKGWAGAVAGVSHQGKLPRLDPRQIHVGKVGNQQRRVVHARLDRAQHIRIPGQRRTGQDDLFAIHRVIIGALGRKTGHFIAYSQIIHAIAYGDHDTGHLMAKARRQACMGRRQVLAPQNVVPADANRFDTHLHFARCGLRGCMLFAFEHLGRTKLVKTDRAGHRKPRQSNL